MGRTNVPLSCKLQTNKQPWRGLVGPWASAVTAAFKMPWWSLGAHTLTDASEAAGGVWPRAPGPRSWFGRLCYTGCMRSHNKRRWRHWPSLDTCCLQVLSQASISEHLRRRSDFRWLGSERKKTTKQKIDMFWFESRLRDQQRRAYFQQNEKMGKT